MSDAVIVALITGGLSLFGIILSGLIQSRRISTEFEKNSELQDARLEAKLDKHEAVMDTKLDELTREVREHNGFARRVPVMEEQIKVANHRIEDLEKKVGA